MVSFVWKFLDNEPFLSWNLEGHKSASKSQAPEIPPGPNVRVEPSPRRRGGNRLLGLRHMPKEKVGMAYVHSFSKFPALCQGRPVP